MSKWKKFSPALWTRRGWLRKPDRKRLCLFQKCTGLNTRLMGADAPSPLRKCKILAIACCTVLSLYWFLANALFLYCLFRIVIKACECRSTSPRGVPLPACAKCLLGSRWPNCWTFFNVKYFSRRTFFFQTHCAHVSLRTSTLSSFGICC